MKKIAAFMALFIIVSAGCRAQDTGDPADREAPSVFSGTLIRVAEDGTLIIEPDEGEEIRQSGTEVSINPGDNQNFELGDQVMVTHEGPVMESHPLQVHLISIERSED